MPQLDPNANYCEEEVPNANLNKQCSGSGQCDSPPQVRRGSTEASPKLERFANIQDPMKRLSLLSIPTSEDSWYNCTSGDESESESSFGTAGSCQDNLSSVSAVNDVRRTKKYYIARELMSSERIFVDALKLLNEDFRNVVLQANAKSDQRVIPVAVLDQILNYLPQLHNLNQDLLKDLQERIKNCNRKEQLDQIADVITKKGPFLKLYSSYIKDFEMITSALDDACKKYPQFAQLVKDFECREKVLANGSLLQYVGNGVQMSARCNKLALKHYMLKPVQRIPQYKLILHEYLKHLNSDSPEYEDTVAALKIVTDVANHANQAMKQGDNFSKLLHIQNSIVGGGYEVIRPGRFNDALLHTDVAQGSLRLHHELPLSGMRFPKAPNVVVPTNEEYLNEFSVISSTRSFTLSANSLQERDEWVSALNNAIKSNALRRGTFALAVDKNPSPQDDMGSTLGKNAPVWIPDSRVTMCQSCIMPFTVTFRRHHCRACGKVVCATCSANRAPLQYLKFQSARVCDECFFRLAEDR
uniref:FYVE, RhoGEF and PH domain-containing protein 6 n=1 Tax=Strigamia maritima TaxID=126957 RepID=T1JLM4_STRMM